MAKSDSQFVQSVKDAQARARRKVKRLQNKGVNTRNISPVVDAAQIDAMTTAQRRAYKHQLEQFISRETRYHAGHEGTPLSHSMVKQMRDAEREFNRQRARMWATVKDKDMLVEGAHMSVEAFKQSQTIYDPATGTYKLNPKSPLHFTEAKQRPLSGIRSEADLKRYIKNMQRAATDKYFKEHTEQYRRNIIKAARNLNDPELIKRLRKLTHRQLYELSTATVFTATVMMYPTTAAEVHGQLELLHDQIDGVVSG